ncbi:MAG: hypothetical protein D6808_05745 [Candidatus Dadabacteria bacterium]|nr:MAG: hypothetical protein D6808_05745 [Candidatus Dadabacteria bacterium]
MAKDIPSEEHDIFRDPLLTQSSKEDPLVRFVLKWWQHILVAVVVVFAGWYMYSRYTETQLAGLRRSADLFYGVRNSLSDLQRLRGEFEAKQGKDKKGRQETQKKIKEKYDELRHKLEALSDRKYPYDRFAQLYKGLMLLSVDGVIKEEGDISPKEQGIKELTSLYGSLSVAKDKAGAFISEAARLAVAKAMLDRKESRQKGRKELLLLAKNSRYVLVPAALALARSSNTDSERSESLNVLQQIDKSHPEQHDLIKDELKHLSAVVEN